jgi:mono/diheme cytochrome c family protein
MKLSLQPTRVILGTACVLAAIGITLASDTVLQPGPAAASSPSNTQLVPPAGTPAYRGYHLFTLNCAHCHGGDARGDEGPNLHGTTKSDQRITTIVRNGIQGEMPRFGAKLNDADIRSLIAFLRTLKEDP